MAASMGMGREMIDWEKPIQAIDGRKVYVCRAVISRSGEGAKVVYVAPPPGAVFGEAFLVDKKGFRCDDSAPEEPVQIIRNARVKREGWVRVISNNGLPYSPGDVVFSERASAELACQQLGGVPAFITWEE